MTDNDPLGGRLPLLEPDALSAEQRIVYQRLNRQQIPWAAESQFQATTSDGRLIGPFNPVLFSPGVTNGFLDFMAAEAEHTSLDERLRQVVILGVGAVWDCAYELYAHSAVARKAGLPQSAIDALIAGATPAELTPTEQVAQRFATQLTAKHRVHSDVYGEAESALGRQGVVDLVYLVGFFHVTCCLLNGFAVPAPA